MNALIGIIVSALILSGVSIVQRNILRKDYPVQIAKILDPNATDAEGYPRIFDIIERRELLALVGIVEAGANINVRGFGLDTPVLVAAQGELWRMVIFLLEHGADPMAANDVGFTVANLAKRSRIDPLTDEGEARDRVLLFLRERGLDRFEFTPAEVRSMMSSGKWPPN